MQSGLTSRARLGTSRQPWLHEVAGVGDRPPRVLPSASEGRLI